MRQTEPKTLSCSVKKVRKQTRLKKHLLIFFKGYQMSKTYLIYTIKQGWPKNFLIVYGVWLPVCDSGARARSFVCNWLSLFVITWAGPRNQAPDTTTTDHSWELDLLSGAGCPQIIEGLSSKTFSFSGPWLIFHWSVSRSGSVIRTRPVFTTTLKANEYDTLKGFCLRQ